MRQSFEDSIDNVLTKMFNTNRDYINQEINRLANAEQKSPTYRRSGIANFGARQMVSFVDDSDAATVGSTMTSTMVQ